MRFKWGRRRRYFVDRFFIFFLVLIFLFSLLSLQPITYVTFNIATSKYVNHISPAALEITQQWENMVRLEDPSLMDFPWKNISEKFLTKEELDFPLAYSILVYRDPIQALMLLRAIYRPHNFYCIHVDAKATIEVKRFFRSNFDNNPKFPRVFLAKRPLFVFHSTFSTLQADLVCMKDLIKRDKGSKKKWRYFINLTGQEYPRKTNLELVRILRDAANGSNLIHKDILLFDRVWKRFWKPPPFGIRLWKGWVHIVACRKFVEFALTDERARALAQYLRDTQIPDESFFSTLNHNAALSAPGGYPGDELSSDEFYPYVNRLKIWSNEYHKMKCRGRYVRLICIFGQKNFYDLVNEEEPGLFINKFILEINGDLLRRIDAWFHQRQQAIYANPDKLINLTFYITRLPQAKQHF